MLSVSPTLADSLSLKLPELVVTAMRVATPLVGFSHAARTPTMGWG